MSEGNKILAIELEYTDKAGAKKSLYCENSVEDMGECLKYIKSITSEKEIIQRDVKISPYEFANHNWRTGNTQLKEGKKLVV